MSKFQRLRLATIAMLACGASSAMLRADDPNVSYVQENGVTYRVTRQPTQHPVTETHLETRESTIYQTHVTTEMQTTARTFPVAVTEYHWQPVYRRSWNVFAPPTLSYELVPETRWETRSDTVQTPVTRSVVAPVKVSQTVPVTSQRVYSGEIVSKVPVGPIAGGAANVAAAPGSPAATVADRSAVGGIYKLDNDPPRSGASWHPTTDSLRR